MVNTKEEVASSIQNEKRVLSAIPDWPVEHGNRNAKSLTTNEQISTVLDARR
jgi:hypothetical protein